MSKTSIRGGMVLDTVPNPVPEKSTFDTLDAAYQWVASLVASGVPVIASKVWADRFSPKPRSPLVKLFGVEKKAQTICERMAPGGKWVVTCEISSAGFHQFSAWYTKYLPYAWAMAESENGFECLGVDFESVNSYYGTCMGFYYIGMSEHIEDADAELYEKCYNKANHVRSPSLPFDEVFNPALVYLAACRPDMFVKKTLAVKLDNGRKVWWLAFVVKVLREMNHTIDPRILEISGETDEECD